MDLEFLAWGGAGVSAAMPAREMEEKRTEPAKQRVAKVRRDIALETEDFVSVFEAIEGSFGVMGQSNGRCTEVWTFLVATIKRAVCV